MIKPWSTLHIAEEHSPYVNSSSSEWQQNQDEFGRKSRHHNWEPQIQTGNLLEEIKHSKISRRQPQHWGTAVSCVIANVGQHIDTGCRCHLLSVNATVCGLHADKYNSFAPFFNDANILRLLMHCDGWSCIQQLVLAQHVYQNAKVCACGAAICGVENLQCDLNCKLAQGLYAVI